MDGSGSGGGGEEAGGANSNTIGDLPLAAVIVLAAVGWGCLMLLVWFAWSKYCRHSCNQTSDDDAAAHEEEQSCGKRCSEGCGTCGRSTKQWCIGAGIWIEDNCCCCLQCCCPPRTESKRRAKPPNLASFTFFDAWCNCCAEAPSCDCCPTLPSFSCDCCQDVDCSCDSFRCCGCTISCEA